MANDKTNKAASAALSTLDDLKALAPEGFDVADAYRTGQLDPLYLPNFAVDHKFPRIVGWLDRVKILPTQKRVAGGKEEEWTPFNLLVRDLKMPTKGIRRAKMGELDQDSIVDVQAGERVLIPVTGQLTVNQDIQDALRDMEHIYWVVAQVLGFRKVKPGLNPMADWEFMFLRDSKKQKVRKKRAGESEFMLPDWYVRSIASGDLFTSITQGELGGVLAGYANGSVPYDAQETPNQLPAAAS